MTKSRASKSESKLTSGNLPSSEPAAEISEEDQQRIITESGILNRLRVREDEDESVIRRRQQDEDEDEDRLPLAEEVFNATLLIIPMASLLFLMEILVHWQYGRKPTYRALAERMLSGIPILSIFVFYTNRYKQHRRLQLLLFILSMVVGTRLIWLINRASWRVVMRQCPPLATLWVYCVLQLELAPATLGLIVVGAWVWAKDMKIFNV
ncbi:hypothetical protein BKA93DRAFT_138881 [Sparassis latifolia]|uniref:DUF7719 domain-containing protein n=1 Tax=Sparassis crispa TaxID=139825 RepID=A0A401GAE5_9APHY|nr:hypothetical protein SCP_0203350 [Sparassis crispa]GBE79138.1 hypothetical protein SCP_0203350 [Sparassis crispa]